MEYRQNSHRVNGWHSADSSKLSTAHQLPAILPSQLSTTLPIDGYTNPAFSDYPPTHAPKHSTIGSYSGFLRPGAPFDHTMPAPPAVDVNDLGIHVRHMSYSYSKSTNRHLRREMKLQRELEQLHASGYTGTLPPLKPRKHRETLSDISMNIPRGSIYGLLGPSGCGKTTLLRCLVGCLPAATGEVSIFGMKPGSRYSELPGRRIGFMPQEFALYEDLTIGETLHYFGRLYLLTHEEIKTRTRELMAMLDMPESSRNVANLSGGQRRRVSFAVALMHCPPLLILDEPTAGVDPLLRERVWLHLLGLCESRRTTIILTTQYIEETRRAHQVAFMRNGRLIAEQSPEWLLGNYQTQTLEDAFLKICLQEKMAKKQQKLFPYEGDAGSTQQLTEERRSNTPSSGSSGDRSGSPTLEAIDTSPIVTLDPRYLPKPTWGQQYHKWFTIFTALLWKNYLTDLRDPLAVCFQFVLPITQVILFSLCIGGSPINIPIGVVNEELGNASSALNGELSPLFIRHINNSLIQIRSYPDMDTAWEAAKRLEVWAVIHIRPNFTDSLYERIDDPNSDVFYLPSGELDNRTQEFLRVLEEPAGHIAKNVEKEYHPLSAGRITVHADMTNKIVTLTTMRNFFYQYTDFFKAVLLENNNSLVPALLPVQLKEPIYGEYKQYDYNGFRDFMIPGIMCNITFAIAYTLTAVTLIKERNGQTIERNHVAGVGRAQLLAAHAMARFSFMVPYAMVIIYLPVVMFELPAHGSLHSVFWLLLMINTSGMSYGMLVSSLCATVEMAIILAAGTMFFLMFACGAIWPLQAVPIGFRWFAFSTPLALPTEALRNILFKGWDMSAPGVWHGFAVCIIYTSLFSWLGLKTFQMNK